MSDPRKGFRQAADRVLFKVSDACALRAINTNYK